MATQEEYATKRAPGEFIMVERLARCGNLYDESGVIYEGIARCAAKGNARAVHSSTQLNSTILERSFSVFVIFTEFSLPNKALERSLSVFAKFVVHFVSFSSFASICVILRDFDRILIRVRRVP